VEQPLKRLESRQGPWLWRQWRVLPVGEGRWRLERDASGSEVSRDGEAQHG
jgi:ribonuclease HI